MCGGVGVIMSPKAPKSVCGNDSVRNDHYSPFKGVFTSSVGVNSRLDASIDSWKEYIDVLHHSHQVSASASTLASKINWVLDRSISVNASVNVILRCERCD